MGAVRGDMDDERDKHRETFGITTDVQPRHCPSHTTTVAVHKSCGGCHANAFVMPSKQLVICALLNHCPPNPCHPRSCCLDPRSCCLERRSRSLVAAAQSAASLCSAMRSLCVAPADARGPSRHNRGCHLRSLKSPGAQSPQPWLSSPLIEVAGGPVGCRPFHPRPPPVPVRRCPPTCAPATW